MKLALMEATLYGEEVHARPIGRNHEKDRNSPLKTGITSLRCIYEQLLLMWL